MASNTINVDVSTDLRADEVSQQLKALGLVLKNLNPVARKCNVILNSITNAGIKTGHQFAVLGASVGVAKFALDKFTEAVNQAVETLRDFAGEGERITEENRGKSTAELPQLYRERETLQNQLKSQNADLMAAGNKLPATRTEAALDWLKGTDTVGFLFGVTSAKHDYEDIKADRDATKSQLAAVERAIQTLEKQKAEEDKAANKELMTDLKTGLSEINNVFKNSAKRAARMDQEEAEDKKKMTLLSDAPPEIQEMIRNAGKRQELETILATQPAVNNFVNSMDRLGGYTSNLTNFQADPQLNEMRKQTSTLAQIEKNTQQTSARYS